MEITTPNSIDNPQNQDNSNQNHVQGVRPEKPTYHFRTNSLGPYIVQASPKILTLVFNKRYMGKCFF